MKPFAACCIGICGLAFVVYLLAYNIVQGNSTLIPIDAAGITLIGGLLALGLVLSAKE